MAKIKGRVRCELPIEQGVSKSTGNQWRKRSFIIDQPTNSGEPMMLYAFVFGQRGDNMSLQPGYDYEFDITFKSREFNGKFYTDAEINFAQPIGYAPQNQYGGAPQQPYGQQSYQPQSAPQTYANNTAGYQQPTPAPTQSQQYQQTPYGQTQPQGGYQQPAQPAQTQYNPSTAAAPAPTTPQPTYQPQATGAPAPQQSYAPQSPAPAPQSAPATQPYGGTPAPASMTPGAMPPGATADNDDLPF